MRLTLMTVYRMLLLCLISLLTLPGVMLAQINYDVFSWSAGGYALRYPATWQTAAGVDETGNAQLTLAPAFADSPESRPPALPVITIRLLPAPEDVPTGDEPSDPIDPVTRLPELLAIELQQLGVTVSRETPALLDSADALQVAGYSDDGTFYGLARGQYVPDQDRYLMLVGRVASVQRESFETVFRIVADSLTAAPESIPPVPVYGALWRNEQTLSDVLPVLLESVALMYQPDDRLLLVDQVGGVIELSASTGMIQAVSSLPLTDDPTQFTDAALAPDGTLYITDVLCQCLHVWQDGTWQDTDGNFAENSPYSIAITGEGTRYVTEQTGDGVVLHRLSDGAIIPFPQDTLMTDQPLLAVDHLDRLHILSQDGSHFILEDDVPVTAFDLAVPGQQINDVSFDLTGNYIIATDGAGIIILDDAGEEVNRAGLPVEDYPERVLEVFNARGVAVNPEGDIYWTDSDGTYGNVTAISLSVEPGRIGSSILRAGQVVQGNLDETTTQQVWVYPAEAGEVVTLTAVSDEMQVTDLDLAMRVLGPDGTEVAFIDNTEPDPESTDLPLVYNFMDAQLRDLALQQAGDYQIIIERISGEGPYELAVSGDQVLDLTEGETVVQGQLSAALPIQTWTLDAQAGQILTILVEPTGGLLDPLIRLINPRGDLVDENDDDPAVGFGAQLVAIPLSFNGIYRIEVVRFDGAGTYRLTVTDTGG